MSGVASPAAPAGGEAVERLPLAMMSVRLPLAAVAQRDAIRAEELDEDAFRVVDAFADERRAVTVEPAG